MESLKLNDKQKRKYEEFSEKEMERETFIAKITQGVSVGSYEEIAAREEEISKIEAEKRREARENSYRRSGIAEKFLKVEFSDLVKNGIAEMKDKDGNVITDMQIFYDFINDIVAGKPRALWLCGKYGTGKSVFAIAIMHELCRCGVSSAYFKTHEVMQRLDDVKWHLSRETRADIIQNLCYPRFRILDEIGRYPDSKWEQFVLFDVTNKCYETFKSSIYISNLTKEELGSFLGGAVTDRFKGFGMTIEFSGKSLRGTEKELYIK